ncbi:copper resistance protein B [Sphingomonas faeni]
MLPLRPLREVQALYSRALDPYWNLQAGVRYDLKRNPSRTYAAIGIEGLAPYWFNVEGTIFLSDSGGCIWPRRGLVRSTRGAVCRASAAHRSEFRSAGRCA